MSKQSDISPNDLPIGAYYEAPECETYLKIESVTFTVNPAGSQVDMIKQVFKNNRWYNQKKETITESITIDIPPVGTRYVFHGEKCSETIGK